MSEPRRGRLARRVLVVAVALCALPGSGRAQSTAEARQELDRLLPEWRATREVTERAERARRQQAGATAIAQGHLRMTVDSSIAPVMARAAAVASTSLDRTFGTEALHVAAYPMMAFVQGVARDGSASRMIRIRLLEADAPALPRVARIGNQERVVTIDDLDTDHPDLVRALEAIAAAPLHAALDDELRLWFRSPLPATNESSDELETMYVELATASTDISRRCLAGDAPGCRQLLGLAPVADPIVQAYTASQRRAVVEGHIEQLRTPVNASEFDRCVVGVDDDACIRRLRDLSLDRLVRSYSTTAARRSFARWAIALGGPDAYARLRASEGAPLIDRFALAAGVPGDSLVASWHARVLTGRPMQPGIPPVTALSTLLWIGVCGALSFRSSRWR